MKTTLLLIVTLLLSACEVDQIEACGRACERSNRSMVKYSLTEGCVCEEKARPPEPTR